MKKQLLLGITAFGIAGAVFAQNTAPGVTLQKVAPAGAKLAVPYKKNQQVGTNNDAFESIVNGLSGNHSNQNRAFTSSVIGTTEYQNQTNASVKNRMVKNPDGTISATWTMSILPDWSDRGTGYNYFNGTSWMAAPTTRVENIRTGFTNVGVTGTGAEFIVSHQAPSSGSGLGTHVASRPVKGTGAWTNSTIGANDTWPYLAVGGALKNSLHIIAQTSGASTPIVPYMGQDGAISYSRSTDGGLTWDKIRTVIPQIDSASYLGFGGDSYSMDAKGDTIAIVAGGFDVDVVLLKSVNNGNSWTKTIVHNFGLPLFNSATDITDINGDMVADTLESNDASVHVLLDNNGKAHVWYGRMRVLCDNPGTAADQGLSYFPYTDGLMYWNENMGSTPPVMISSALDLNGDGELNIYTDPSGATWGVGQYQLGLSSMPTAGIDAAGRIYVSYAGVFEGLNSVGEGYDTGSGTLNPPVNAGKSFRHTYLMRSDDNGATWCGPIDITDPDLSSTYDYIEGVYGAMARDVDGFVHLVVQQDNAPGHGVSTTTTPDPQSGAANIIYYKVPVADVACGVGINEAASISGNVKLFPNPASDMVTVEFTLTESAKVSVKVLNILGQEISKFENQLSAGQNSLKINTENYDSGVYFINSVVNGKAYTSKLIKE